MTREWNVWGKILERENCKRAVLRESATPRCIRNGLSLEFHQNLAKWVDCVRQRIGDGLTLGDFVEFDVMECGKKRHVRCYTPEDAMCVRACVQVMEPRAYARMSPRSYCPVIGRGGLKLALDFRHALKHVENKCRIFNKYHPKATKWRPWIGQFDERHYYDSITYQLAHDAMERIFGEPEVLEIIETFLAHRNGLPIGAGYSSMIANTILAPLDWKIIGTKGVFGYARHLDNAVYVTKSKKIATDVRSLVEEWNSEHGLQAHEWAKFPSGHHAVERGGWRIDKNRILPSTNVTLHIQRLLSVKPEELSHREMLALASLYGYVKHGESLALKQLWKKRRASRIFRWISISAKQAETGIIPVFKKEVK